MRVDKNSKMNSALRTAKLLLFGVFLSVCTIINPLIACGSGQNSKQEAGITASEKSNNKKVPSAENEADKGMTIDEESAYESAYFNERVKLLDGVGDFGLTAYKDKDEDIDFVVRVENRNDFPTAALIECIVKDSDGNVLSVGQMPTEVMVTGAQDLVKFYLDVDIFPDCYDSVEFKAFAKENNATKMIDYYDASEVNLVTGAVEKGGMYDKWNKVEVKVNTKDSSIGDALTMFYDAEGNLIHHQFVWTSEKSFNVYCKEPYDHVEVLVRRLVDNVPGLPESIYEEYREKGFVTAFGETNTYTSPDGKVEYYFFKAEDGSILLRAKNKMDYCVSWNVDNYIFYNGKKNSTLKSMYLSSEEELVWNIGFDNDSEFWLLEPIASQIEETTIAEPKIQMEEKEGSNYLTVDVTSSKESLTDEAYNNIWCRATVLYYKDGNIIGSELVAFYDEDLYYRNTGSEKLSFQGEYDSYEICLRYGGEDFMLWMP